jgi:hypothetical protein
VFYSNLGNRINYGVGVSHIPSAFGGIGVTEGPDPEFVQVVQRVYQTQFVTQASYPLSQRNRFELSAGGTRYGFGVTARNLFGQEINPDNVRQLGGLPDPIYLGQVGLAYVGDFSSSGLTSPLQGGRYRFQVTPQVGSRNFVSVLADWRRYFYREPFTFAVRGLHRGNYGGNFTGQFSDLFLRETVSEPYQVGFVRGYSTSSILDEDRCRIQNECDLAHLYGSRMALGSAEIRLPLLGPEVLGVSTFKYLPTDLVLFADAGVAWTSETLDLSNPSNVAFRNSQSAFQQRPGVTEGRTVTARPVTSAGVSARVNVLGAVVFEAFYARTFQRARPWDFGLVLRPGW